MKLLIRMFFLALFIVLLSVIALSYFYKKGIIPEIIEEVIYNIAEEERDDSDYDEYDHDDYAYDDYDPDY